VLREYFAHHVVDYGEWDKIDDNNKETYGWVPLEGRMGSELKLEFHAFLQPVRSVTLFIMKSYGDKWDNPTIRVQLSTKPKCSEWSMICQRTWTAFTTRRRRVKCISSRWG